jgi:hypothetical protein
MKIIDGGRSERINPPIPVDLSPLSTRAMNNRVKRNTNPHVVMPMSIILSTGRVVLLSQPPLIVAL